MPGIGDPDALRVRKPTLQEALRLPETGHCRLTLRSHNHEDVHGGHPYAFLVQLEHPETPR